MARQSDGSTNTLASDFEQVCQPMAPQVTQLWYKKVGNRVSSPMYTFILFSGTGDYQQKKGPQWSLLHAFRLSKIESTIEHLLSRACQKSTRSYHNSVPKHHPTKNSLVAFPLWVAFFQSTLQCFFLGSHQYQKCLPPPIISHLQRHSRYYSYDPIPLSQVSFAAWSTLTSYSEQRKFESLAPLRMVVSHVLGFNYIITPLRFVQGIDPCSIWSNTPVVI